MPGYDTGVVPIEHGIGRNLGPIALVAISVLLAACAGEPSISLPIAEGERCGEGAPLCTAADELLVCEQRVWTAKSCDEICAETGHHSLGCLTTAEEDSCACDVDGESLCGGHSPVCTGWNELATCGGEDWIYTDCGEYCAGLDPPMNSLGCAGPQVRGPPTGCVCTLEGMPCSDIGPVCDGPYYTARCEEGVWTLEDCTDLACDEGSHGRCEPWGDEGASCVCKEY